MFKNSKFIIILLVKYINVCIDKLYILLLIDVQLYLDSKVR